MPGCWGLAEYTGLFKEVDSLVELDTIRCDYGQLVLVPTFERRKNKALSEPIVERKGWANSWINTRFGARKEPLREK